MSVLDFLKRKKEDQIDLNELGIQEEEQKPRFNEEEFKPAFPSRAEPQSSGISGTDVQLILTKLDLINQRLENMDRRLQVIEKVAKESS